MPHSYGASFSGVGFLGPRTLERRMEISANPAPSAIMTRMESQPCIDVTSSYARGAPPPLARLVNDFPSQADMLTHGVVVGRWSLVIGHWSLVVGHWSLVVGRWSLVVGRWSLVIGRWSLVVGRQPGRWAPHYRSRGR